MNETTRRRFLAEASAAASLAASGCLDEGGSDVPDPVDLDGGQTCDFCGMVIDDHPGPVAEIFYRNERPEGREAGQPAWFCSTVDALKFQFEKEELGWTPVVRYVTDYSDVDHQVYDEGSSKYVTAHTEAGDFVEASRTTLVAGSDVHGAMGPSLIPFSDESDAGAFQEEHGGELLEFDDVSEQLLSSL